MRMRRTVITLLSSAMLLLALLLPTCLTVLSADADSPALSTSLAGNLGFRKVSGESLTAQVAASSASYINAQWTGAMMPDSEGGLELSFTLRRLTPAAPGFALRIRAEKGTHFRLLSVNAAQELRLFNEQHLLTVLGDRPLALRIVLSFTAATSSVSGTMIADVYLDGAYVGRFETEHSVIKPSTYLQFYGGIGERDINSLHIGAENGVYLCDGKSSDGTEERTTFSASDPDGYYGILELSDLVARQNPSRGAFIYAGASMRLAENAASSGLRFTFGVDRAYFDSLEGATVGAIILPTDRLGGAPFSEPLLAGMTEGKEYVLLTDIGFASDAPEADEETYVYCASLISLLPQNYARAFTAVGFVELADGSRIYTGTVSRSVAEVARNYSDSPDFTDPEATDAHKRSLVSAYLDRVVFLQSTDDGIVMHGGPAYRSPYTLLQTEQGFTLSGEVGAITAIVLDGTVYTCGWQAEDGRLTVTLPSDE